MKWSPVFLLLASSTVYGQSFDPNVLLSACLKEKNLEFCRELTTMKDGSEKFGISTLKSWNMLDFATVAGTIAKIGYERKISFTDRTNWWYLPGHERSIDISEHKAMLTFKWPLPW